MPGFDGGNLGVHVGEDDGDSEKYGYKRILKCIIM